MVECTCPNSQNYKQDKPGVKTAFMQVFKKQPFGEEECPAADPEPALWLMPRPLHQQQEARHLPSHSLSGRSTSPLLTQGSEGSTGTVRSMGSTGNEDSIGSAGRVGSTG